MTNKLLYQGNEWTLPLIEKGYKVIEKIAKQDFNLDFYEPQIEIINYEQMLDRYSSNAMPVNYAHWSFGKSFIQNQQSYKAGQMGLAYEVVINTNPSICHLLDSNTMTMQMLTISHAAVGHSAFFKNNYLFKEWTDPTSIIPYLKFAKKYIQKCEDLYGERAVERTLDAAHSLQYFGVDKYKRKHKKRGDKTNKLQARLKYVDESFNDLWNTVLSKPKEIALDDDNSEEFPQENFLYFLEKNSRCLKAWQKELLHIVRTIGQYFYPQSQTKMLNEGFASFTHYNIMGKMADDGYISEGNYLEFIHSHTGVCCQFGITDKYYDGNINPYALGFSLFKEVKRICQNPTKEDLHKFPDIANSNWIETTKDVVANFRDESAVRQFLTPKLVKDFGFFEILDEEGHKTYEVAAIQDEEDFERIRTKLAEQYTYSNWFPRMEIDSVTPAGDLVINYYVKDGIPLEQGEDNYGRAMAYVMKLWGGGIRLDAITETGKRYNIHKYSYQKLD